MSNGEEVPQEGGRPCLWTATRKREPGSSKRAVGPVWAYSHLPSLSDPTHTHPKQWSWERRALAQASERPPRATAHTHWYRVRANAGSEGREDTLALAAYRRGTC